MHVFWIIALTLTLSHFSKANVMTTGDGVVMINDGPSSKDEGQDSSEESSDSSEEDHSSNGGGHPPPSRGGYGPDGAQSGYRTRRDTHREERGIDLDDRVKSREVGWDFVKRSSSFTGPLIVDGKVVSSAGGIRSGIFLEIAMLATIIALSHLLQK